MKPTSYTFIFAVCQIFILNCGGGVPVEIRIDEFAMQLSLDDSMKTLEDQLSSSGILPAGSRGLPEVWPESLPPIRLDTIFGTPVAPVDLTPDQDSDNAKKYNKINKVGDAIRRIEINRFVLRVEQNTLSVALPQLRLQIADDPNADPADRRAWQTVGHLPGAEAAFVGDLDFEWVQGGESFLNYQLGDDLKEFGMRTVGKIHIDTEQNPNLPRGSASLRLIVVATFFVEPEKAL